MRVLAFFLLVYLFSCANAPDNQKTAPSAELVKASSPAASVTVTKNGTLLAEYESPGAAALLDEGDLTIELNSPNLEHSLVIEIENAEAGNFPIVKETQEHSAVLIFMGNALPMMLSPNKGSLKLDKMGSGQCSGSFSGELLNSQGERYQLNGQFESIPLKTL